MKAVKINVKYEKESKQKPLDTISIVYFYKTDCLQRYFHGLIVTLRGWTLLRHVINLSQ